MSFDLENIVSNIKDESQKLIPAYFDDCEKEFEKCSLSICLKIIKKLQLFQNINDRETLDSIKNKINFHERAEYLIVKILIILCEEGILENNNNEYICKKTIELEEPSELLVLMTRRFPKEGACFQWLARSYEGMIDFITNQVYPEDILFPYNNLDLITEVYNTSENYEFYSKLTAYIINEIIENVYKRKIKILEVGAGTGNGTRNVLNYTHDKFDEYVFTDISRTLIRKSSKNFTNDFMSFKIFDVTKSPIEQGFKENYFDIIFAVNVIHATKDIKKSIKILYDLLKKDGCLVISEISPYSKGKSNRYMDLTFGLLPSYFQYSDKELRPDSPLITLEQWNNIISEIGLNKINIIPYSKTEEINRGGVIFGFK